MELESLLKEELRQSIRELANKHQLDQSTVLRRVHSIGKINKIGKRTLNKLIENNMNQSLKTFTVKPGLIFRGNYQNALFRTKFHRKDIGSKF